MKNFYALTALLIPFLLGSCSNPTQPAYDGPGLHGQVFLEDSTGTRIPPPYAGITVTFPGISVSTDSLGNWTIQNPPQGNYNIVFSKDGFGSTSFSQDYNFTDSTGGWNDPDLVVLTQAPDSIVRVENVLVYDSTSPWTPEWLIPTVTATSQRVFIFIDTIPNVSSTGAHFSHPMELLEHDDNEWSDYDPEEIGYLGLHHGQTVYVTACAGSSATKFLDSNNHEVLGNVGPASNAYPVVIP